MIATGGLAALFDTATEVFDSIDGDLTLKGLALVERDFGAQHDRQAQSRQLKFVGEGVGPQIQTLRIF